MAYQAKEKVNNALVVQTQIAVANLANSSRSYLEKQLPNHKIETLVQEVRMCIAKSTGQNKGTSLAECSPESILGCMITCASMGVSLNPDKKLAYLIPYREGQKFVAQTNISYLGLRNIITRDTGIKMRGECVYSKEPFEFYSNGFDQVYKHTPLPESERGDFMYAFSLAKLPDGEIMYERMTKEEVQKCRDASKGGASEYSPWTKWFESMALKSVTRRQCKLLPNISNETVELLANDEAMAIGRPQFMETAYEKAGIKVEAPPVKNEEEVSSAFTDIFGSDSEPIVENKSEIVNKEEK